MNVNVLLMCLFFFSHLFHKPQVPCGLSSLPDFTACGAHIVEFHTRLSGSLLRLEEDGFMFVAAGTRLVDPWQRWILGDVLGYAGSFANGVAQLVAEDARGRGVFFPVASSAREFEGVVYGVFFGIEHVGAFATESECYFLRLLMALIASFGAHIESGRWRA